MEIKRNWSLKNLHTFSVGVSARYFTELSSLTEIQDFIRNDLKNYPRYLFLGGGSNVLFTGDYDGLVIGIRNTGIEYQELGEGNVRVTVQSGENWERLVDCCTDKGLGGLENLAMIPGNAGSAPIQNIGAYGAELKDVFHHLEGIFPDSGETAVFNRQECRFGYRDSIFKRELKGRFLITSITLDLVRNRPPDLSYNAVRLEVEKAGLTSPAISDVRDIIKEIRRSKLPDPKEIGNAGSFFKNPVVSAEKYRELLKLYPEIAAFEQTDGYFKLAAGWLIESCGWKGRREGDAGVHAKQALVLVNYGEASGEQILGLAGEIIASVKQKYGVELDMEVNIIK